MDDEGAQDEPEARQRTSFLGKVVQSIAVVLVIPVAVLGLLVWTLVGRLCSLGPCAVFCFVAALVLAPGLVDLQLGQGHYAFDNSLLDPVCVLVAMYVIYLGVLRDLDSGVEVSRRRRLMVLPVAVAVAVFLLVKIVAVADGNGERWKVSWLCLSLLVSIFVYVSMARWWTNASVPRLQAAEAALLDAYGQVEFEQSLVAGLGTVIVKDAQDPEQAVSTPRTANGKPTLVLVHGYAAGNAFWMFILKDLSAHFRVICVEMYGCGRSDRLPFNAKGPAETERLVVESLEKWRETMGIQEMVLCGHSLGGMITAAYAMAHPHRLRKLVLLSPAGVGGIPVEGSGGDSSVIYKIYAFLWNKGVGPLGLLRWCGPFGSRMARVVMSRRLTWVPKSARIRDVDTDLLGEYVYQLLALPASGEKIIFPLLDPMLHAYRPVVETLKGGSASGDRGGEEGEGPGISCPVSIIYGSPDHDWMPHRHGVALAERLTRQGITANVYTVPEAGHTLIIDNPEDFTRIFLDAYFHAAGVADAPLQLPLAAGLNSDAQEPVSSAGVA